LFPIFSHHSALFLRGKMAQSSSNRQVTFERGAGWRQWASCF